MSSRFYGIDLNVDLTNSPICFNCDSVIINLNLNLEASYVAPFCPLCFHRFPPSEDADEDEDEDDYEDMDSGSSDSEDDEYNQYQSSTRTSIGSTATSFLVSLEANKVNGPFLGGGEALCPICSDEFQPTKYRNQMTCGHWFHSDCIVKWLNIKSNCPMCHCEFPRQPRTRYSSQE